MITVIVMMLEAFIDCFLQLWMNTFPNGKDYLVPAFILSDVVYIICAVILASCCISKSRDSRWFISIGTFTMILSLILIGTIPFFMVPRMMTVVFIGLTIGFSSMAFAEIPIYNELLRISAQIDKENGEENDEE